MTALRTLRQHASTVSGWDEALVSVTTTKPGATPVLRGCWVKLPPGVQMQSQRHSQTSAQDSADSTIAILFHTCDFSAEADSTELNVRSRPVLPTELAELDLQILPGLGELCLPVCRVGSDPSSSLNYAVHSSQFTVHQHARVMPVDEQV